LPSVKEKNNDIPNSVANIVKRSTAKNLKNRYLDAREMNEDLKTCLNEERLDEEEFIFEFEEVEDNKKSKKIVDELENTQVDIQKPKKTKKEGIKVEQITEEDMKTGENKLLTILAIVFTSLIVIITAIVFLLPKLTEAKNIKIPDVKNMSVVEAESVLESAGFEVATETKDITSADVEVGNVVKTSPTSGRTVKEGSIITLYVSSGEGGYELEDLTGLNYIEQKAILEKMYNLYVEIIEDEIDVDSKYEKDEIISTEPAAGTILKEGDTIKLHIPDTNVLYPDFTTGEYSLSEIEEWAEKYNVELLIEYEETSEYEAGTIFKQSKEAGEAVVEEGILKIYISESPISTEE